jgi:zinc protease
MSNLLLYFLACGPKEPATTTPIEPVPSRTYTEVPQSLEPRPFQIPSLETGSLSNGIEVVVSHNSEIPKVNVLLTFGAGSWSDSNESYGLAMNTMDMLDEGTSEYSAANLATEQKKLAARISSSSGLDGSYISLSSLKKNLSESLALFSTVVLDPSFPEADWEKMKKKKIQDLQSDKKDPNRIASKIFRSLLYGDFYAGRQMSEEYYSNITTTQMKEWYTNHIVSNQAKIWISGDIILEEILPLLEEQFGTWSTTGIEPPKKPGSDNVNELSSTQIYFHDIPNAQQSVLRMGHFVGERTDDKAPSILLANQAVGGMFTARVNMNLREDKGWTYGARSYISHNYLPGVFMAYSSVVTPHTADSIREIITEFRNAKDSKPISQQELDNGRGYFLGTWPLKYENATYLLNQNIEMERYNLPEDWISGYPDRLRSVTLEQAQNAWNDIIDEDNMVIVIVGDLASTKDSLLELGYSIQQVDAQGNALAE